MRRTYKYRAKINKETEANAIEWINICRTLYNLALEQRILHYNCTKQTLSAYDQINDLPALKNEFSWFKKVNSQTLQDVIERLDKTFKNFFRRVKSGQGRPGFPRFKGQNRYDSFTLKQSGWKLEGKYLYVRGVGRFKLFLSRPIVGKIKTITIRRTKTNKWFVSFSCDGVPEREFPSTTESVGIDLGIEKFATDSDGLMIDNPRYYRNHMRKLRRAQRALSRKKKGSSNRVKCRLRVAKIHEKITNVRNDFLHKVANYYVKNYQVVCVEDLNINGMLRNRHLSLSIADASWGKFLELLNVKAEEAGRTIVKVPPTGTSQRCSNCGETVKKTLSVRVHKCPHCNIEIDRDLNAALNILAVGQTVSSVTWDISPSVLEESHAL